VKSKVHFEFDANRVRMNQKRMNCHGYCDTQEKWKGI